MSGRRLSVRTVIGTDFGRFSGRSIDLPATFCVVHGPNESGKSTLSELIAWVLAGIVDDAGRTLRYGQIGDVIGGRIIGDLDGTDVVIERSFNVRADRRGELVAATEIRHGELTLEPEAWRGMIGVTNADDYARRYRITDDAGYHSVAQLLDQHALGGAGLTPNEAIARLRDAAIAIVPAHDQRLRGDNPSVAAGWLRDLDAAKAERVDIEGASRRLEEVERSLAELGDRRDACRSELEAVATRLRDLDLATELLGTRNILHDAEAERSRLPAADPDWATTLGQRDQTRSAIAGVADAEQRVAAARRRLADLVARHGIGDDQLERLTVEPGTDRRVDAARHDLERAGRDRIDLTQRLRTAEAEQAGELAEFERVAAAMGLDVGTAERFADTAVSDITIVRPIDDWAAAERQAEESAARRPTRERQVAHAQDELDRARAHLDALGGGDARLVAAGADTDRPTSTRSAGPAIVAVAMVVAAALAFVHPLAAVAAVAVVAAVSVVWSRRPSPTVAPPQNAERRAAAELVLAAEQTLADARRDLESLDDEIARSRAEAERHRDRLGDVLDGLAVPRRDSVERARLLVDQRSQLATLRRHILERSGDIQGFVTDLERVAATIVEANAVLTAIADEVGLPGRGEALDRDTVGDLRDVVAARVAVAEAAAAEHAERSTLRELTGSDQLAALAPSDLDAGFAAAVAATDAIAEADRAIDDLRRRIERDTADRPGVAALLDDPDLTVDHLQAARAEAQATHADLERDLDALEAEREELRLEQRELADRSDLPAIGHRVEQAENELAAAVQRGAAAHFARKLLADIKDDYERERQPTLVRRAGELVVRVTSGEWSGLRVDEQGEHFEVTRPDGRRFPESKLSSGAMEVLRLATRVALADEHGDTHGIALPLICDDPTGDVDSGRSPRLFEVLAEAAERRQVLLFTHDEHTVALAEAAGAIAVPIVG